ncbi:hypothetical protein IBA8403_22850 [Pseudomonas syringae]
MNIFEALRESHDRQRSYADALIQTSGDSAEREKAYKQLKEELQAHETAEERFFYIPLMAHDNGVDLSRHAISEHHEMDEMMEELDETEMSSPAWLATAKKIVGKSAPPPERRRAEVLPDGGQIARRKAETESGRRIREGIRRAIG